MPSDNLPYLPPLRLTLVIQMASNDIRFFADRTATQYDRLLAESCRLSVRSAVHCDSRDRCTGLKVVPACP